jgi:cytoskeletal protein CcmA (bactofilin family)
MAQTDGERIEALQESHNRFTLGGVPSRANAGKIPTTVIGPETEITGDVKSSADITIAGRVNGDIVCEGRITISQGGVVNGRLSASEILIHGKLNGDSNATRSLAILGTGEIVGDVTTPVITIEPGAVFAGRCNMTPKAE